MKLLLKSAVILDPDSKYHQKKADVLIKDGKIEKIGNSLKATNVDREVRLKDLHISKGWFDSSVSFGEPGFEERETIKNGLRTAAKSGFTAVALNPDTLPIIDTNSTVSSLFSKSEGEAVRLFPVGALTVHSKGNDLAELYDMQQAGAVAFGDYKKPVSNPNLLKMALLYTQNFNGLVQSYPQDIKIAGSGLVNEEENSTKLGLKGIPALAEELQITRDLYILEYTGGKLHIPTISTEKSVKLIREAKKKGLNVTCSVAIHNLLFTDDLLSEFDTSAKVLPPLRTKKDLKALIKGVKDGTIDMVTSDHTPIDIEHKKVEFENALYGTIGLESAFGALLQIFSLEETIEILTRGREIFNVPKAEISEGSIADFSLFTPKGDFTFTENNIYSTSKNSLFLNTSLSGRVYGIVRGNHSVISE